MKFQTSKALVLISLQRTYTQLKKTAWFVLQRIRWAIENKTIEKLKGDVEIDETYVGGVEKNKHTSRKTPNSQGGNNKMAVFGEIERNGNLQLTYIKKSNIENIKPIIENHIDKYISSFVFYFNNKACDIAEKFDVAMNMIIGKRLQYAVLTAKPDYRFEFKF